MASITKPHNKRDLFAELLATRNIGSDQLNSFLNPDYDKLTDPFLLPDMQKAVDRLVLAHKNQENIIIHGDYDVDGTTATALVLTALQSFGFKNVAHILPDRIADGYGISPKTPEILKQKSATLLITVDCGSSDAEIIDQLNSLKIDTIITDHHEIKDITPKSLALINPKHPDSKYPFPNLAGVAMAFQLIRGLQTKFPKKLPAGQEKWLLDLVAIGTICDCMDLVGENRTLAHFGLKVLAKTRRPGLKSLMKFTKTTPKNLTARSIGFQIGPRLNAAGRIETATTALELLLATDTSIAYSRAQVLDDLNQQRRSLQDAALKTIDQKPIPKDPVLFVKNSTWHEGVIGIIASKLVDKYHRPTFVFTKSGKNLKASARSFGDFSLAEAIESSRDLIIKGGGHSEAAGVTLDPTNYTKFKTQINKFYKSLNLSDQEKHLRPREDLRVSDLSLLDINLYENISRLEPFGIGNPEPVIKLEDVLVEFTDRLGTDKNHLKLTVSDQYDNQIKLLAFSAPTDWFVAPDTHLDIWVNLTLNEWRDKKSIEGRIVDLKTLP